MSKIFDLDMEKCVACGACAIACMDQNDRFPNQGDDLFRCVGVVEPMKQLDRMEFLSVGCMHCEDAPCITACPCGCLYKDENGLTVYDNASCIGCHSCAMACPYGAPTFGTDGKMQKCDGCSVRVKHGLLPACVQICPTKALTLEDSEEYSADKKECSMRMIVSRK